MTELLPCPFCGNEAEKITSSDGFTSIGCLTCNPFFGVMIQGTTEAEAIEAWNTRTERTCRNTNSPNTRNFICSECGESYPKAELTECPNYCPNCGAKVIEE